MLGPVWLVTLYSLVNQTNNLAIGIPDFLVWYSDATGIPDHLHTGQLLTTRIPDQSGTQMVTVPDFLQ